MNMGGGRQFSSPPQPLRIGLGEKKGFYQYVQKKYKRWIFGLFGYIFNIAKQ